MSTMSALLFSLLGMVGIYLAYMADLTAAKAFAHPTTENESQRQMAASVMIISTIAAIVCLNLVITKGGEKEQETAPKAALAQIVSSYR